MQHMDTAPHVALHSAYGRLQRLVGLLMAVVALYGACCCAGSAVVAPSYRASTPEIAETLLRVTTDPLVKILFPPNHHQLDSQELYIEIAFQSIGLIHRPEDLDVCISMRPLAPQSPRVPLDLTHQGLIERCFRQNTNYTTFNVAGLMPGYGYVVTVTLAHEEQALGISMRTIEVAAVHLGTTVEEPPLSINEALEKAIQMHEVNNLAGAMEIYEQVIELAPHHPKTQHLIGLVHYQQGRLHVALPYLEHAVQSDVNELGFHNSLALCLQALGRIKEATEQYQMGLKLEPTAVDVLLNYGDMLQSIGKWQDAAEQYRAIIQTLVDESFSGKSRPKYQTTVRGASQRLCDLVRLTESWYEAEKCVSEALVRWPNAAEFHLDRGHLMQVAGQFDVALSEYESAAQLGSLDGLLYMAEVKENVGFMDESISLYDQLIEVARTQDGALYTRLLVMRATVLPRVLPSSQDLIEQMRKSFEEHIDTVVEQMNDLHPTVVDPGRIPFSTAVTLHSHNRNNVRLKTKVANMYDKLFNTYKLVQREYKKSFAVRPVTYLQSTVPLKGKSERLRIGFVSRFFFHPVVALYMNELLPELNRTKYEIIAFPVGYSKAPFITDSSPQIAEHVYVLPRDLHETRHAIREADLDILVYPELGMDQISYFLALERHAPVQAVWWGNPDTSCLPTIDFFLASEYEHPDHQSHYCETVHQMRGMGIFHSLPELAEQNLTKSEIRLAIQERFSLDPSYHMYLTVESILHIHPDFDNIVHQILQRDEGAHFFFISVSGRRKWRDALVTRLSDVMGEKLMQRVHFLYDVDGSQELRFLHAADCVLASVHLTRQRAAIQAFTAGAPVVTMVGSLWSSRITYGFYQQMGMNDLVAHSVEEYVDLALKLANDSKFRGKMRRKIRRLRSNLSQNRQAVDEWERFFDDVARDRVPRMWRFDKVGSRKSIFLGHSHKDVCVAPDTSSW